MRPGLFSNIKGHNSVRKLTENGLVTSESGQSIIELLVAIIVFAVFSIGLINILVLGVSVSGTERYYSQANSLAQQTEDTLSGDSLQQLESIHDAVQTQTLSGTTYTIVSDARAISARNNQPSCISGAATADYFLTTTTVTWPNMGSAKPVTESGTVIPPAKTASLVFDITDENGNGVSGANTDLIGPSPDTTDNAAATGSDGCAAYLGQSAGTYSLNVSKPGYVTPNGISQTNNDSTATQTITLADGSTSQADYNLAPAGSVQVTPQTVGIGGSPIPGQASQFVIFNTSMALPSFRTFGTAGTYTSSVSSPTTVYPFVSPYVVYAGSCTANDPHANDASITDPTVVVPAGNNANVTLSLPALIVLLYSGTSSSPGTLVTNPQIFITDTDTGPGCDTSPHQMATVSNPVKASGDLSYPGLPYGTYSICADVSATQEVTLNNVTNNNPTTGTTAKLYAGQAVGGQCPS